VTILTKEKSKAFYLIYQFVFKTFKLTFKATAWAQMMEDASDNEEEGKNEGSHPASRKNSESQNFREPREQKQRGEFSNIFSVYFCHLTIVYI
jgi:hypothetical protein